MDCAEDYRRVLDLDRDERFSVSPLTGLPGLQMTVQLSDGRGGDGVRCVCMAGVRTSGGMTVQESLRVRICGADEAFIFVTARTDMSGFMGLTGGDPEAACLPTCRASGRTRS